MRRNITAATLAAFSLIACARTARVESGGDVDLGSTPVDARTLPSGTNLTARLDQSLGTKTSRVGDSFTATVKDPVIAENGRTVVPSGAVIHGKVTALKDRDNPTETAVIRLDFESLQFNGRSHPFEAKITATNLQTQREKASGSETGRNAGIGAVAGAVLGAVLSQGDLSKIAIGAVLGAAAGTAISLGTGDVEAVLPAGSEMTVQTTRTVAIR